MRTINLLNKFIAFFLLVNLFLISCTKEEDSKYRFPLAKENNINELMLAEAYELADDIENIRSLLVSRNNVLISEAYFTNNAQDELHDVMSVTKSFTSTLVGIAIDHGYINSLDQTLGEFIGPSIYNLDEEKSAISLFNLLRMSCGIPWKELGDESEFVDWYYYSDDQINYILDKDMTYTPGTMFNYSDGAAHLMSAILTEATGKSSLEFAKQYLFTPLGIDSCTWKADNRGYNFGGVRLKITPLSMLKFGELIMNDGVYDDQQLIPKSWIDIATISQITTNNLVPFQDGYGLFWWTGTKDDTSYFFANGYGGQFIIIVPGLKMIIVATNTISGVTDEKCHEQWYQTLDIIINKVIPSAN